MQPEITKSPVIPKDERVNVSISRDLHHLLAMEATKNRLKVKDLVVHFLVQGLLGLGVDVSGVITEVDQQVEAKEVA